VPRKRKKGPAPAVYQAEDKAEAGRRERDRVLSRFWSERIRAGLEAKRDYVATADEVVDYFRANHQRLFEDASTKKHFMDFQGAAAISVPKVAQMRNALGPRLYQAKPVRTVSPKTDDGVMLGLARLLRAYLNYTVRESKFTKHLRAAIDDGLLRGRCFLQQEWDPIRRIVTSTYLSSLDVVFDPDFATIEDAKWIAIRCREPFWETERRVTETWRLKNLDKRTKVHTDTHAVRDEVRESATRDPAVSSSNEILEYWIVLSKMGRGFRGASALKDPKRRFNDDKEYCRLEVVLDHEVPLAEGDWEVPLYLDNDWPISYVDFIEATDSRWPDSITGQVLPCQKGVDLLTSLQITGCKNRNRLVVFVDSRIQKLNQQQLRSGTSADMISMDVPNGMRLQDAIHVANFGVVPPETAVEREFLIRQIEATTGVTPVLTGEQNQGAAQDRSATATQARNEAANARVSDLRQRVEELTTDAARKEALIARLTLDEEDITPFVRVSDIDLHYVRIEVPGGVPIPVRDTRPEEERKQENPNAPLTLEAISPSASNYFEAPEQAYEAAVVAWQDMQTSDNPRVMELARALLAQGVDPETQLPFGFAVDVVTPGRVWEDTAGMTPEELMRELNYEIATGSGQKVNQEAERANADDMTQTVLPVAIGAGDYATANKILKMRQDAYEVPQDQRVSLSPPLMPPGGGGGGGPSEGGEGKDEGE
jgi:hypothetical protein